MDRHKLGRKIGFGHFMASVGHHKLLTAERETHLAKQVAAGAAAETLLQDSESGGDGAGKLRRIVGIGLAAREELIRHNIRLAINLAKAAKPERTRSLQLEDLISEGIYGLIHATGKFDPTRGYRFSTYATWWIKQSIGRALQNQDHTIRVPVHVHEKLHDLKKARHRIDLVGLPHDRESLCQATGMSEEELERVLAAERLLAPASLDKALGDDGDTSLGDLVEGDEPDPVDAVAEVLLAEDLLAAVADLPDRERIILEMRFGLLDGESHTLDDVGNVLDLTRERVRQLQVRALKQLQGSARSRATVEL